jgi:NADPH-dependent curcumin reductase CurA
VQIAKKMIGCKRVIGIAGTPEKCALVESLGADVCLDYRAPDFKERLIEATNGYADVYLDLVGGDSASGSWTSSNKLADVTQSST